MAQASMARQAEAAGWAAFRDTLAAITDAAGVSAVARDEFGMYSGTGLKKAPELNAVDAVVDCVALP